MTSNNDMKLIVENWRGYLNEQVRLDEKKNPYYPDACATNPSSLDAGNITTLGCLMSFFAHMEPSMIKKLAGKYGGAVVKALTIGTGVAIDVASGGTSGGAGTKASVAAAAGGGAIEAIGGEVLEKMLMAAVIAFANIPDGSYSPGGGSAASFFDIDDAITIFLRNVESKEQNILNPSVPEVEAFTQMKEIVQAAANIGNDPNWASRELSDVLSTTTQQILDANLLQQDKVKIQSAG